ncbi:VOC family protein, partial [Rhizobium ruizarguesonis]
TDFGPVRPGGGPLVVVSARDLEEVLTFVERAGGTICRPITAFPGGRRFHFLDRDDYELAVWAAA